MDKIKRFWETEKTLATLLIGFVFYQLPDGIMHILGIFFLFAFVIRFCFSDQS